MSDTTSAPRAVLADDERLMREQLRSRIAEVWPELQIVAEAKNGLEAVELVKEHKPDLVFLDIRMPGLTGVEAAKQIAQLPDDDEWALPEIVFITAYDQYAVEAVEQGVCDYVLKPAERDLSSVVLGSDELVLLVHPRHALAGRGPISMEEMGRQVVIAHNDPSPLRDEVLRLYEQRHAELNIRISLPSLDAIKRAVEAGLGVALLPRRCAQEEIARGQLAERLEDLTRESAYVEQQLAAAVRAR